MEAVPGASWFFVRRDDGRPPLRVRGVAPGERVLAQARAHEPGWGDLARVLAPAPARRPAPCAEFGRCGGCHWLHLGETEQRRLRADELATRLAAAGLEPGALPPRPRWRSLAVGPPLGYRWRARFQACFRDRPAIGFHAAGTRRTVDLDGCPLLAPPLAETYRRVRTLLADRGPPDLTGFELATLPGAAGALLFLNPRDRAPAGWRRLADHLLAEGGGAIAGVSVRPGMPGDGDGLAGAAFVTGRAPGGQPLAAAARGFLQAHLAGAEELAAEVARLANVQGGPQVVELYAGTGLIGWRLAAAGADVTAVEADPLSVAAGRALPPPGGGRLSWDPPGDAAAAWPRLGRDAIDLVVADPPRSGLGPLAARLVETGPGRLLLVSCSLTHLARDVAVLTGGGFRVEDLVLVDLFPQTRHAEAVALLHRRRQGQAPISRNRSC